ncbi:MAG: discoidin domain-containing protein [Planctomycetota bacterium]
MQRGARWMAWLALVLACRAPASAEDRLWLARDGEVPATILRGNNDDFAAERLQGWLATKSGAEVEIRTAAPGQLPEEGCVVLVGSLASNPLLAKIAGDLTLELDPAGLTEQGYVARRVRHEGRDWLILAGGGRDGAIHAVVDLVNWHANRSDEGVWIDSLDVRSVPRFPYRWLWTWDNRMDWGGTGKAVTRMGGGKYEKEPGAFLVDYKRCVDFMADHKFNGLILWGFLRDSHGGVEAAQELCRYAARRGVRILPGVGTSGYAGYYYEGNHPLNADTWLAQHPDLCSIGPNGKPRAAPCPSKKANQDWLDRGAEWLFENFEVGGVNLEMGDFFVCHCDDCRRARAAIPSDEPDYYKDMAISHMVTLQTMRRLAPDAWLSYATYTGYTDEMVETPPRFLSLIPEDAICQWTLTGMAQRWPADVPPMAPHNLGYLHWCNTSTGTEEDFYLERVRTICRQAAAAGFEGLDTYGELPDTWPNAELFYLAWEAFLWDPEMTVEEFVGQRLARLYGGREAAGALLKIVPLVRTAKDRQNAANCTRAREAAEAARGAASTEGHQRWDRLTAYLGRHEGAAIEAAESLRRGEAAARAGRKIAISSVRASDEEREKKWPATNAVDGNVDEPQGYWLTQYTSPAEAWIELALEKPERINRVVLFHQLNPGHYRSLDYTVSVRVDDAWKPVAAVKNNEQPGWVAHALGAVVTDAVRLEITRSAHGARMGVGEIEVRMVEETD